MMYLVRLKNISILLLAVLLSWCCMCAVCGATEKTYTITESQLTQLEMNLTKLKEQNKTLQEQLQTQVRVLNQSLTNAQKLLTQYENNNNNDYAIGLGISKNGIAVTADIENKWITIDEKNIMVGYKFKF